MIKYNNSTIVRFPSAMVSGFVSRSLPCWSDWELMWSFFSVHKIPLESLQQLKLPSNTTEGDHPRTTLQLQFFKELTMVRVGYGGFK